MRDNKKLLNEAMNRRISLDDKFFYGCTKCGKCCQNISVMLNGYDIYRLAKHFNTSIFEFIKEYCTCYPGENSFLPVVILKFEDGKCPLLKDKKCSVHDLKPFVCASYPIGRGYSDEDDEIFYFLQDILCGFPYKEQTVKEWIYGNQDLEYEEEVYKHWNKLVLMSAKFFRRFSDAIKLQLCSLFFEILYCSYSTDMDFLSQLKDVLVETERFIKEAMDIYEEAYKEIAGSDAESDLCKEQS